MKRRTCRRCRSDYTPTKPLQKVCSDCRTKCCSCNAPLTKDNQYPFLVDADKQFYCKSCIAQNVSRTRSKKGQKNYDLTRNYGISLDEYLMMFEEQGGVCAICYNPPAKLALSVDHKHQKNEKRKGGESKRPFVRGLLCWSCNAGLAKFRDDPAVLERAVQYLKKGYRFTE